MAGRLADKVALVAGAGPNMGRAVATLFAQEGAKVVVAAPEHREHRRDRRAD